MISEVMRFYGYKLQECLDMPASQFFVMLKTSRRHKALELMQECDVQAVSICSAEYYEKLKASYYEIASGEKRTTIGNEVVKSLYTSDPLPAESQEAKYAVMSLFAAKKRGG